MIIIILKNISVISQKIDNELILLNLSNNFYHIIKGIGVEIWDLIPNDKGMHLNDLYKKLSLQFNDLSNTNKEEIKEFIFKLESKKIVIIE